jgi:hypothetical protein
MWALGAMEQKMSRESCSWRRVRIGKRRSIPGLPNWLGLSSARLRMRPT